MKFTMSREVDKRILAFFYFPVKKMKKKNRERVQNIGNIFPHSLSIHVYYAFYTRIFVTLSPYRSFFFVIFLLVSANPMIATKNPKNPIQKSVSTLNVDIALRVGSLAHTEN